MVPRGSGRTGRHFVGSVPHMFYSLRCGVAKIHRDNRSRAAEAARVLMILRSDPFNDSTLLVVLIFQSVPASSPIGLGAKRKNSEGAR